jgi:hypothetical protein
VASVDEEASLAVRLAGVASLAVRTAGAPSLAVVVSALVAVVDSVLGVAGAVTSSADACAPPKRSPKEHSLHRNGTCEQKNAVVAYTNPLTSSSYGILLKFIKGLHFPQL